MGKLQKVKAKPVGFNGSGKVYTTGQQIRRDFAEAFDRLGGVDGLVGWAKEDNVNMKVFYTLFSKMVTKEVVTEDKNKSHDQFIKWIQEVEEQETKQIGQPLRLVD